MLKKTSQAKLWIAVGLVTAMGTQALAMDKDTIGTVVGGVLGGILGSNIGGGNGKTAATIAGAVIGAVVGHEVGDALDERDREEANRAYLNSLNGPVNQPVTWDSRDYGGSSGYSGSFVTTREFTSHEGYYCRSYVSDTYMNGRHVRKDGSSCNYPDGSWQVYEATTETQDPVYNAPPRPVRECRLLGYGPYRGYMWNYRINVGYETVDATNNYYSAASRIDSMRRSGFCY